MISNVFHLPFHIHFNVQQQPQPQQLKKQQQSQQHFIHADIADGVAESECTFTRTEPQHKRSFVRCVDRAYTNLGVLVKT